MYKYNKEENIVKIGVIPYHIVALATHSETLDEYLILRGRTTFTNRVLPLKMVEGDVLKTHNTNELKRVISGKRKIYQHSKNKRYYRYLTHSLLDCEFKDPTTFSLYESLYDNHRLWLRPQEMFAGKIILDGKSVDRFRLVFDQSELTTLEHSAY